jgi:Predicted membrane protein (DUF2142)
MSIAVADQESSGSPSGRGRGARWVALGFSRAWRFGRDTVCRVPRAGRICFALAFVNAAIWGVVVPPFQVPDEIAHFGYAQYLAETGKPPPQGPGAQYSAQEQNALGALDFFSVIGRPQMRGILTTAEDRDLRAVLATHPSPIGEGGASSITSQPPLYYALEAIPYWLSPSHDILTRLALMRLLSALIAACTVLTVFLFLRELFPGTPWTWTVGALAVAFQPTFNFIAAGVQGDNLLFLASAMTFLVLLRAYRRGLTMPRSVAIGLVVAVGVLAKLTFIALLPGIALTLALLAWRAWPAGRRNAVRAAATAVAVAAAPVALYALLNVVAWHRGSPTAGGVAGATNSALPGGGGVTLPETLDYIWGTWLDGAIGHFGWLDYTFPQWVYRDAQYLFYALAAVALVGLAQLRAGVGRLLPIFLGFGVMALGLLGAIGYAGIRYRLSTGFTFEQGRYLFPLLVFYAAFVVLVARGAGRRWGPAVGAALVVLAMAHGLFAETLTISRYYG